MGGGIGNEGGRSEGWLAETAQWVGGWVEHTVQRGRMQVECIERV